VETENQPAPERAAEPAGEPDATDPTAQVQRDFDWFVIGPQGLRAGWSILLFTALFYLFQMVIGILFFTFGLVTDNSPISAAQVLVNDTIPLLALVVAAAVMSRIESRPLSSYNLAGPHHVRHFFSGVLAGCAALSLLVGILAWGGWLHFGAPALAGPQIFRVAALWGVAFLVVALVEEGAFRCYALFTLARGINFWWALAAQAAMCLYLALFSHGQEAWGVYAAAALGFLPCLILHQKAAARSAFWQAAWVTSTVFGFYHTGNSGENWIGIFAAAFMGFVFCVSVRVTGSALWALGCHAGWDWMETFFYGTADSGMTAPGHFLTARPAGNPLWSGGADGPEGSVLVIGVILLLLVALLAFYGRRSAPNPEQAAQAAD